MAYLSILHPTTLNVCHLGQVKGKSETIIEEPRLGVPDNCHSTLQTPPQRTIPYWTFASVREPYDRPLVRLDQYDVSLAYGEEGIIICAACRSTI